MSDTMRWSVSYRDDARWVCFASFQGKRAEDAEGAIDFALAAAPLITRTRPLKVSQYLKGAFRAVVTHHDPREAVAA